MIPTTPVSGSGKKENVTQETNICLCKSWCAFDIPFLLYRFAALLYICKRFRRLISDLLEADMHWGPVLLPLFHSVLEIRDFIIRQTLHVHGQGLLEESWILCVAFPNVWLHFHDQLMDVFRSQLGHHLSDGQLSLQFENSLVFKGLVVFHPSMYSLEGMDCNLGQCFLHI